MSLGRQGALYLLVGGLQWLLDWVVMVLLSHAGMAVRPANVAGRVAGALLGFWMNGRVTFASEHTAVGRRQLVRFLSMWLATTVVSTLAVGAIDDRLGLHWAWLGKPVVDLGLAAIQFFMSRHWVYRR